MLAGGETVRGLNWRKGPISTSDQAHIRSVSDDPLEPVAFSDTDLQCAIVKHIPHSQMLTVEGHACDLALTVQSRGFPFKRLESLQNPFSASNAPIVRRGHVSEALVTLFSELNRPILLKGQSLDSELLDALDEEDISYAVLDQWERAVLKTTGTYGEWLAKNFDHKRRKELKRLRNRLSEQGQLATERMVDASQLERFVGELLRLENEGWKGERGSSIIQSPGHEPALREGLDSLSKIGKLRFWQMTLDGVAIASLFAVVDNGRATLGKIAFDEKLAKYSPGQLIIMDATKDFFEDPYVTLADSNAIPRHPMINHLWRDRANFGDIMIAPRNLSRPFFQLTCATEQARRRLRDLAKSVYYKLKGERPS
jgi:CelD/BcsL family acetyltransferase involved in cellulose biosynthesis